MSSNDGIRVMLVDDHPIMRRGLCEVLEDSGGIEVVGQAADGVEAVRVAGESRPDVVVMDMIMPKKNGIEACREIMETLPDTRVLVLTASTEDDAVIQAIAAGAAGFILKYSPAEELIQAVRAVAEGQMGFTDQTVRRVFKMLRDGQIPEPRHPLDSLTRVEQEVVRLFASGWSYAQIGEARRNSAITVRNTLYRVQNKLGIGTKQELVVWAVRNGLLDDHTEDVD